MNWGGVKVLLQHNQIIIPVTLAPWANLQAENEPLENAIAGRLLAHWLKQLIKEVFSG